MATKYNPTKCKSCARILATVSPTGLVRTTTPGPDTVGCQTCSRFSTLYNDVQAANAEWSAQANKRDSITKTFARDKHRKVHMEFVNWLMTAEAPATPKSEGNGDTHDNTVVEEQGSVGGDEQQQQGTKRRRSHPPTTQQSGDINVQDDNLDSSPRQQQGLSLSFRLSPKRPRRTSASERKRLKFSDSVEFRDEYRTSEQYHRPSDTYVRGRNAPPEGSEYMDTSGSGQTFLKFTLTKKVGAKWVEFSEEELAKKSEDAKVSAELRKLGVAKKSAAAEGNEDAADELNQDRSAPPDARAARLARRAKGSSTASLAQNKSTKGTRGSTVTRKSKKNSLDRALNSVQEPIESGPEYPKLIANATDTSSMGELDMMQEIGAEKAVQEENIEEDLEVAVLEAMRNRQALEAYLSNYFGFGNQDTIMAERHVEAISDAADHSDTVLSVSNGNNVSRTEPKKEASCIAWEDAYMASLTDTGKPTTIVRSDELPSEHKITVAISPIAEEQMLASLTSNYSDSLGSLEDNGLINAIPQPSEEPSEFTTMSTDDLSTINQPLEFTSADTHSQADPQDTLDVGRTTSPDAQPSIAAAMELQEYHEL
jgi:hypothetical protein